MTSPLERGTSFQETRKFLMKTIKNEKLPLSVRKNAWKCLWHYPTDIDLEDIRDNTKSIELEKIDLSIKAISGPPPWES